MRIATICGEVYLIDDEDTILSPGPFEGEQAYVPYFWDKKLVSGADRDNGVIAEFDVRPEDAEEFPRLRRRRAVSLYRMTSKNVIELRR